MPGKSKTYSPKWLFNGDLPWYKVKNHLKIIQEYEFPFHGINAIRFIPDSS